MICKCYYKIIIEVISLDVVFIPSLSHIYIYIYIKLLVCTTLNEIAFVIYKILLGIMTLLGQWLCVMIFIIVFFYTEKSISSRQNDIKRTLIIQWPEKLFYEYKLVAIFNSKNLNCFKQQKNILPYDIFYEIVIFSCLVFVFYKTKI